MPSERPLHFAFQTDPLPRSLKTEAHQHRPAGTSQRPSDEDYRNDERYLQPFSLPLGTEAH